jgi:hypothetical protein
MPFNLEVPARGSRRKIWLSDALAFGLVTISTAAILLCPCDLPGRNTRAVALIVVSTLFSIAAVVLIYRRLQRYTGITAFLRAVYAAAIVALAVYLEFDLAIGIIAWLARRSR